MHRGEYFELLGPAKPGHYGDVNWHPETMALPAEIVKRFDGKVMALTGMESDIVYVNADGSHTSAPCTEHYNHHFSGNMIGKAATIVERTAALSNSDGGPIDVQAMAMSAQAMGMQPEQQPTHAEVQRTGVAPLAAGATCNVTGRWLNQANHIYIDIVGTSVGGFKADCEGAVGWKGATGKLTPPSPAQPQGGLELTGAGPSVEHATFGMDTANNAPACTEITFAASNKWCKEPFCGGPAPAPPAPPCLATPAGECIPHASSFSEGNGNEHRVSFHGYLLRGVCTSSKSSTYP